MAEVDKVTKSIESLTIHEDDFFSKLKKFINFNKNPDIILLHDDEVIKWIFSDFSFLPNIEKKNKKSDNDKMRINENNWGREKVKIYNPSFSADQWTNTFGERICKELFILLGHSIKKPKNINGYQPDLEIKKEVIEVKTGTYFTTGTAHEKILGCPFKYAEVPTLYKKSLKIVCIGGAEKRCREEYNILPSVKPISKEKQKFIDFYKQVGIEVIAITDILKTLI